MKMTHLVHFPPGNGPRLDCATSTQQGLGAAQSGESATPALQAPLASKLGRGSRLGFIALHFDVSVQLINSLQGPAGPPGRHPRALAGTASKIHQSPALCALPFKSPIVLYTENSMDVNKLFRLSLHNGKSTKKLWR